MSTISFFDLKNSLSGGFTMDTYSITGSSYESISAVDFNPMDFADDVLKSEAVTLHNALKSIYDKVKLDNCTVQEAIDSLGYSYITDVISAYVTDSHSAEEFAELAEAHLHVFKH